MDLSKLRKGVDDPVSYNHLLGRVDVEAMLEDLGIDFSHRLSETQVMCHCPNLEGNHANGDANPSWGFREDKLIYGCFVCGGGTVLDLVQMMRPEITDNEDALKYVEQFADFNISTEDFAAKIKAMMHKKEEEETTPDYPPESLFQYRFIHPYLYERGFSKDVIVEMQVGYDEEHDAIVIPHFFMGKLVGMQKRHLTMKDELYICTAETCMAMKRVPKFKNTPNFPKVNTLYGYDQMKEYVVKDGISSVIVVESPMSVLKLKTLGYHRVVATFGMFNREQASLLWPMEKVYYWPDSDPAGRANILGNKNHDGVIDALKSHVDLRIVPVVDKAKGDAADLWSTEEVAKYLQNSIPASLFPMYSEEHLPTLNDVLKRSTPTNN